MRQGVRALAAVTLAMFIILAGYLSYIQVARGEDLALNPNNPRLARLEQDRQRGTIFDRQGRVLAQTIETASGWTRVYPLAAAAAPVVGYTSGRYGSTGLEAAFAGELLGLKGAAGWQNLANLIARQPAAGLDLTSTIDAELQSLASDLLSGRRGAIVALEPRTGAILALASSPSFNPNDLDRELQRIAAQPAGSPLLNRAILGFYPPGSTMKMVTAAAALADDPAVAGRQYFCPGYIEISGRRLNCPRPHGIVSFSEAVAYSCNVTFAGRALAIGPESFAATAAGFGFNQAIPFELPVEDSSLAAVPRLSPNLLAEVAIGQGEVAATPLHMALIAAAVANDGLMMQPYLVAEVRTRAGQVARQVKPRVWRLATGVDTARAIIAAMEETVRIGTGQAAALPGVRVAGKTGSAQNPQGEDHAWFVAVAPVDDPRVAVAVIVENGGTGGGAAAPLARQIIVKAMEVVR